VWLLNETPSSIHRKLNLPDQDQGIDLICETNDGEYWAVQAKYHEDETTSQTWRSLSTFTGLAFGVCKNISFGLVCTTSERYTKTLKNQDNIGFCTGEIWRGLDEDFFTSLTRKRKPKKLKAYKPFNHQKRAIKEAHKHYVTNNESRGKMIMPCGTGKSLTAFWIAEKLHSKMILVAVPSLSLIRQTLQVWLRETYAKGWDVDWITVCSDKTVSKMEKDDLAVLTQDLGIPAVTDPKVIASWLRKRHSGRVVVFTTYQSGKAIAEATRLARRNFDLGIMDEAHKTVGKKDKTFAHLLFDENIKISKRVFMTATERRYTGIQDTIVSMDDYDVYGETFEFLSFKDALDEDPPILSDYKIVTVMVGNDEIAELVKTGKFVKPSRGKWDDEIQADTFASLVALRKAVKKYRIKHALSFHSNIARAEAYQENQEIFTELFTDYQKMDTFFVSGKMPTSVRDRHLRDFESSKRALISNARCLTEGVDVPDIDCVLFADPKRSTIDIVQAVGRALRKSEGKKYGYVIVPVVIEKEGQGFEESQAFQSILMTLRALASNDERIIDYFRDRANGKRTKRIIEIDLDPQIAEEIDEEEFIRELELKAWDKLAKLSWRPFEDAREFVRKLRLSGSIEWKSFSKSNKKPLDIPVTPWRVYKNDGWVSLGDWLGTGYVATSQRNYLSYNEAREFVSQLGLKSLSEWDRYCKGKLDGLLPKPSNIPNAPIVVYSKQSTWVSVGDFLGTGSIQTQQKVYLSYKDASDFAKRLNIKSVRDWQIMRRDHPELFPDKIPGSPQNTYKNRGWISWGEFLGTGRVADGTISWRPFKEAKEFVHQLGLNNYREWRDYCNGEFNDLPKMPKDIPSGPRRVYKKKGWFGFPDWLGTYKNLKKGFRSFESARAFARSLKIDSISKWRLYNSGKLDGFDPKPFDVPSVPDIVYKNEWIDWNDWLGKNIVVATQQRKYLNYTDARRFARKLGLGSVNEWSAYCKGQLEHLPPKPDNIPAGVTRTYKNKGWKSFADFLGYEPKRKKK